MKVDNYAVSLNAQHFNVERNFTEAKLSRETENFHSSESSDIDKLEINSELVDNTYEELSQELSKAVLKNIALESRRSIRDTIEMSYTYEESQSLNFQVQAYIHSDSKEIELSLEVSLSRSFIQKTDISIENLKMLKDPLLLSFDGRMPSLSTKSFSFDIDSDGESEQISKPSVGSAFLAFDKNSNGVIDNGLELFGTQSGNGFADLKAYDDDKNGWIDENDAIFDKLRIWQKNDNGDRLIGLGQVGIGAIFLGSSETPFSLKSDSNELLGEMRKSGFFVYEDGQAGVMSQVDLIVSKETQDDLEKVEDLQKDFSYSNSTYKKESANSESFGDKQLEKLQKKLDALEAKLSSAKEEKREALQAQIAGVYAQMMAIVATKLS